MRIPQLLAAATGGVLVVAMSAASPAKATGSQLRAAGANPRLPGASPGPPAASSAPPGRTRRCGNCSSN